MVIFGGQKMSYKFQDLEVNSSIVLLIHLGEKSMEIGAVIQKHLAQNLTLVTLDYAGDKRLNFDNVQVDVQHQSGDGVPILWHQARVIYYKDSYLIQINTPGARSNRRNSYRVSVGAIGWLNRLGKQPMQTIIKDVSMTGFAVTDRKKELHLMSGDRVSITFDDITFKINLEGKVVRIEKHDDYIIYGFAILSICKDLTTYINMKQRRNRK